VEKVASGSITGFFTKGTEYADYYGRMYYIGWVFGKGKFIDASYKNTEYEEQALSIPQDKISRDLSDNILSENAAGTGFSVEDLQRYRKDSREALKFTYRLETLAGDKSFIIGSGLSSCNPLVIAEDLLMTAHLYVLKNPLTKFDTHYNIKGTTANISSLDIHINIFDNYMTSDGAISPSSGKAWALALPYYGKAPIMVEDEQGTVTTYTPEYGGEILIGRNIDVSVGDTVGDFVAYAVHDLQAYITARREAGKLKL
jgi:hypothetical protein